jgi:hypothetical protein
MLSLALLTSTAYGAAMKTPDIKVNPNPRMKYEITVTIEGAPVAFDRIEGTVDYKVTNDACVPMTHFTGVTIPPEKRVSLPLEKVSGNVYKASVYADLLQDENYFGMGVCHWSVVAASALFHNHKTTVVAPLFIDKILAQAADTHYYSFDLLLQNEMDIVDSGEAKRSDFKDQARTYSVTLTSRENLP